MDDKQKIYTIGYTMFQTSNGIDTNSLFNTLKDYGISYLVDVRSIPYSRQYPQCNADALKVLGERFGIPYVHMPQLGAKADADQDVFSKASDIFFTTNIFPISKSNRPEKTELFADDEIVDFQKFVNNEYFLDGLKRISNAYDKGFTLALMCSEKEPMNCHRYFLVSKEIEQRFKDWIFVNHLIKGDNGEISIITNKELTEKRKNLIFKKEEIKKLDIYSFKAFEPAILDDYYGNTQEEKIEDFCNRYWNMLHGWKKYNNINSNNYD